MLFLRFMSFLMGCAIVIGAPFLLMPEAPQRQGDGGQAAFACLEVALAAAGFLYIGVAGHHMRRSRGARALAALLMAFPIFGSLWILHLDDLPKEVWMIGPLLFCSLMLFFSCVYPGRQSHRYRRLRPHDPAETVNP